MAAALALMAAVMVAREASRSVQGEADGGLVVVAAAAGVGVVAAAAADGGGDRDLNRFFFYEEDRWTLDTRCYGRGYFWDS